jgi:DNA end-binding protein Ku
LESIRSLLCPLRSCLSEDFVMTTVSSPAPAPAAPAPETALAATSAGRGRPSWSGLIKLGLLSVPVKAYPATGTAPELPCHQLHAGCGRRIRYEKRCPEHGPLEAGAIVKGYECAPGQFCVLDEAELDRLRPARDRALELDCFLDAEPLDPVLFSGRSLYLAPDGPAAQQAYTVLAQAMRQRRKAALGRVVLSGRRQLVLLRPAARLLVLHLLHFPAQLRGPAALEADLRPAVVGATEDRLAEALIDAYSRPVTWADYRDDSAERLASLVEAKLRGGQLTTPVPEESPALSLLDALRQSVAALRPTPAADAPVAAGATGKPRSRRRSV